MKDLEREMNKEKESTKKEMILELKRHEDQRFLIKRKEELEVKVTPNL
jgi:hypothetical protein